MPTLKTLVSFNGTNGSQPKAGLTLDAAGDLFGTTTAGGTPGNGTVFEIAKTVQGYASTPITLVNFNGTNGELPSAGLLADSAGDLFGTTQNAFGGAGTVFELVNNGGSYTLTTFFSFNGNNGAYPTGAGVIADAAGNLFGTTAGGPVNLGGGTVFEVAKTGSGYASAPTVLVGFSGAPDGFEPMAGLVADAAGDLFGTTYLGGVNNSGTVFEVAKTGGGYASTATILVNFNFANGAGPAAGLIIDSAGDLFGTTQLGGANNGQGTVFELANNGGSYTLTTPVSFNGADGGGPLAGLIADAAGNLFGTTAAGGAAGEGTVFEVAKIGSGYASTPTTVVSFGADGITPEAGLIADAAGNLFGTTDAGGSGNGTAFEVTDSGFQVPCYLGGTRILTDGGEIAVERLAVGDRLLTHLSGIAPIEWIGHRHLESRRHPDPRKIWPVRVRRGAFAARIPKRDLWLSPDHAVFVNDVLIPIRCLVNDSTIVQEPWEEMMYFHVELAHHDVLLAEGLPAESLVPSGNRADFDNGGRLVRLHPDFHSLAWEAEGCAPLVVTGPALETVRAGLLQRAARPAARSRRISRT